MLTLKSFHFLCNIYCRGNVCINVNRRVLSTKLVYVYMYDFGDVSVGWIFAYVNSSIFPGSEYVRYMT